MSSSERELRRCSWWTFGVGAIVFVVLAVVLVPWHPYPGGALDLPSESSVFTAAELDAMASYTAWARGWGRIGLVLSLLVVVALGFTRCGRRLVARMRGPWWFQVVAGVLALQVFGSVARLVPDVAVRQRRLELGLSNQSWAGFAEDRLASLAVSSAVTCLGVLVLVACARRWRSAWPAVAGALAAAMVMLASFAYPVLVQPLLEDVTPLPDGELRSEILALAQQQGVGLDDVHVVDASRWTTTFNAHVSGFGSTRRVVLYDTLVADAPREETLAVVAHELAHAKHDDVLAGSVLGAAGAVVAVGLLGLLASSSARAARRNGSDQRLDVAEPRSVPRLLALLALGSLMSLPIQNTISRHMEIRADVDSLMANQDAAAFRALHHTLATRSLADPTPAAWSQFWFGSHPTTLQRLALAERVLGEDSAER